MNVSLPLELAQAVNERARNSHVPPEELVREAIAWYLRLDESLVDDLRAWQEVRDEAFDLTENGPP